MGLEQTQANILSIYSPKQKNAHYKANKGVRNENNKICRFKLRFCDFR